MKPGLLLDDEANLFRNHYAIFPWSDFVCFWILDFVIPEAKPMTLIHSNNDPSEAFLGLGIIFPGQDSSCYISQIRSSGAQKYGIRIKYSATETDEYLGTIRWNFLSRKSYMGVEPDDINNLVTKYIIVRSSVRSSVRVYQRYQGRRRRFHGNMYTCLWKPYGYWTICSWVQVLQGGGPLREVEEI